MNESFYTAVSFLILVAFSYKKLKSLLDNYLENSIRKVVDKIDDAEDINKQAQILFAESQKKFEQFVQMKNKNLEHAQQNALQIQEDHVKKTQELVNIRKQEFDNYLLSLEKDAMEKARAKIAGMVYSVLNEAIKYEKFNISNKLN
jgi:F0F1-type ATP synthase membrane subunit b/b'